MQNWPVCPDCGRPADELTETVASFDGATEIIASCNTCRRRDILRIPVGRTLQRTFFGMHTTSDPRVSSPSLSARPVGPAGGNVVMCALCGEPYEMLRDEVYHRPCSGRPSTVVEDRPSPAPSAVASKEEKEPEKPNSRFSWLEVD